MKKNVLIDMDHVLVDFDRGYRAEILKNPEQPFPQSKTGWWYDLLPIPNAIQAVEELKEIANIYILTRPSVYNANSYTEKRMWIEKHLGFEMCQNLILCYDKTMVRGDYLIDDSKHAGIFKPTWEHIHFGHEPFYSWVYVVDYLNNKL